MGHTSSTRYLYIQVCCNPTHYFLCELSTHYLLHAFGTAPACLQAVAHQQELQRLHKQYAAILQDTLSKMRSKLQDEYNAACEGT